VELLSGVLRTFFARNGAVFVRPWERNPMPAVQPTEFRYTRAIITFFAAYVIVTLLAVALSMAAEAAMHNPPTRDMVHSPSYVFAEKFFPIINLLVWTAFSWVYFKLRRSAPVLSREALTLGAFWLLFAILVDYVGFVLIKNPISLSAHDFYIGQFPWIYLIYLAILVSPILYVSLRSKRANR
jgi:hypothetical protein